MHGSAAICWGLVGVGALAAGIGLMWASPDGLSLARPAAGLLGAVVLLAASVGAVGVGGTGGDGGLGSGKEGPAGHGAGPVLERDEMVRNHLGILTALNSSVIVAITDARGRILHANDKFCEISGYTRAELLGQDHRLLNSGHHPRSFWSDMYRTVASGRIWRDEVLNRAKDGRPYWVDTTITGIRGRDGRIERMVAIRIDITDRKQAEMEARSQAEALMSTTEQLRATVESLAATTEEANAARRAAEAAAAARSQFLAMMSHEIRTPMTAILGYAEILCEAGQPEELRAEAAQIIRRNGQHLLSVINDILDLNRIEAGRLPVAPASCSPGQIAQEIVQLLRDRAEAKGLALRLETDASVPERITTDPTRLRQILLNLVGNAVKFTDAGSVRVSLGLVPDEIPGRGKLRIAVIDTGPGIAPDRVEAVFAPFTQADDSTSRRHGGTGLGLTISQRLAELLGGRITLESVVGVGSTFTLEIPAADEAACVGTPPAPIPGPARPASILAGRILLVEDSPDSQRLLKHHLSRAGAIVTVAEDGRRAIDTAMAAVSGGSPFDLIIMDMQMPEIDGYEATRRLRGMGYTGPIVALTAHSMDGEREKCLAAGCNDYASKPLDRAVLIDLCRRWMDPRTGAVAA